MPCARSPKAMPLRISPEPAVPRVTGAFAFSAKSRCLNVAYSANCGRDLFDGLSGRRSIPQPNDLLGVQASESPQTATALRVDGYE
jgi:hypothetical protein